MQETHPTAKHAPQESPGVDLTMSNTDAKVYKNIGIPTRLADTDGMRFILLRKDDGKRPLEAEFLTKNNYTANDPKLRGWLRGGGNYGILTGLKDTDVFDADELQLLTELGVMDKLPETYTVATGGGGEHRFFVIPGLQRRITMFKDDIHLGEIQSKGNFVVGPGSIHQSGKQYVVTNDVAIATLTYEKLIEILGSCGIKTKKKNDKIQNGYQNQTTNNDVQIERIAYPLNAKRVGSEIHGEHPIHGATKKEHQGKSKNFSINTSKNVWICRACDSGGGWVEWLAVREGIIRCNQAGPHCLSKEQYKEVMKRAEELGLIDPWEPEIPINQDVYATDLLTEVVDELPVPVPEGRVVIKAPPRTGKTHRLVEWMKKSRTANYFAPKHSIVEHAVKIGRQLGMRGAVWVVGMNQPGACRTGTHDCGKCGLKPGQQNYMKMASEARKLMWRKGVLTVEDVPKSRCPYYEMKLAEPSANYCFTVINNIDDVVPRELTEIDEDPAINYFYPQSIEIARMKNKRGDEASKNLLMDKSLETDLDDIIDHGKRPTLLGYAEKIREMGLIIEANKHQNASEIAKALEECLLSWEPKNVHIREEMSDIDGDKLTLEQCVRALGHLYKECPISVMRKQNGYMSIYILADERVPMFSMDWVFQTTTIVVVGATRAELFIKYLGGHEIEVEDFRYKDRFTVLAIEKDPTSDKRAGKSVQRKKVLEAAKHVGSDTERDTRVPFMVLAGSKMAQESIVERVNGSVGTRKEREKGLNWLLHNGSVVVFYQNSIISRGLDVDQFNLLFVHDCNFAQPFWGVADPTVANSIMCDETTNSVLRISPTQRKDEGRMKLVVMPADDVWKVRYLDGRVIKTEVDAKTVGRMIRSLGVAGEILLVDGMGTRPVSKGVKNAQGMERLHTMLANVDTIVDEWEIDTAQALVMEYLKSIKKNRGLKTVSNKDIYTQVCKTTSKNVARIAIETLYYAGKIQYVDAKRQKRWHLA